MYAGLHAGNITGKTKSSFLLFISVVYSKHKKRLYFKKEGDKCQVLTIKK
jgi:hypothetical protein